MESRIENDNSREPMELVIRLRMTGGDALPASFIGQTLSIVESEIFGLDRDELEVIFDYLGGVSDLVRDACYQRIDRYRGSTLLVADATSGSIVLAGVCSALAYWLVENTVGESIKDAYKESGLHDRLKALLTRRFTFRSKELESRLNKRFFVSVSDPSVIAEARIAANDGSVIEVTARLNKWERVPPSPSDWDKAANDGRF